MSKLVVATDLSLPVEAVTEKLGFIGRTGSGKTYAAQKLAEEMHKIGAQFVVLDPVGVWWGLRLAKNGKDAGIAIPVFGGLRGDVPLEPTAGKIIADLIVDKGTSAVIDVSQFESDADKARFATDFAARFFFRKKAAPSPVHIFIEEAQEFVPQNTQRGEERMLHAFHRLIKLGRNFGIGASLITQRPQEVNKKVLNQTELLFVFQLTGPHERKAVEGWIQEKGVDEDIAAELPKLQRGKPHAWSPGWLQISRVVSIAEKWTFDASSTPKLGDAKKVRELGQIDIEQLGVEIKASVERAKAEDPKELRKLIADREREIAQLKKTPAATRTVEKTVVDQAVIDRAVHSALSGMRTRMKGEAVHIRRTLAKINAAAHEIVDSIDAPIARLDMVFIEGQEISTPMPVASAAARHDRSTTGANQPGVSTGRAVPPKAAPVARQSPSSSSLAKGEKIVLTAVAQYPEGAGRDQLTVLTGYKRSTRDAYIQRLAGAGYVEIDGSVVRATDAGIDALGPDYEPLPEGEALQEYWLERLPAGESQILAILLNGPDPESVGRGFLTEETGYKRSTRDAYIQRLKSRRLVEDAGRGEVRASANLFGGGR